jgi:hypothetical protein
MPHPLTSSGNIINNKHDDLVITAINSIPSSSASISSLPSPSTSSSSSISNSTSKIEKTQLNKLSANDDAKNSLLSSKNLTPSKRINSQLESKNSISQLAESTNNGNEDLDDEIKVYKEEGTAEEEKRTSDNLSEEKTEIVKEPLEVILLIMALNNSLIFFSNYHLL